MATSVTMKIENTLEKYFRPPIAPESEYNFEPIPRENKTRRQRIEIEKVRHRNHCKRVKVDTEASFEMMVGEVKNVMKDANHHVWKDLETRVQQANEILWKIGMDLKTPSKSVECAELMRMSKITMTLASYLETQEIRSQAVKADMEKVFKVLWKTMSVGVANLPRSEHKSLVRNLFKLVAVVREDKPSRTKPLSKCKAGILAKDIQKEVEKAKQAYKGLRVTRNITFGLNESAYSKSVKTETPQTDEIYIDDIMTFARPQ